MPGSTHSQITNSASRRARSPRNRVQVNVSGTGPLDPVYLAGRGVLPEVPVHRRRRAAPAGDPPGIRSRLRIEVRLGHGLAGVDERLTCFCARTSLIPGGDPEVQLCGSMAWASACSTSRTGRR